MVAHACSACGSALQVDGGRALCSNDACPGGGMFFRCGYCGEYSFSVDAEKMYCYNQRCRMFQVRRDECPDCKRISLITFNGQRVCINRDCPTNKQRVRMCWFCEEREGPNAKLSFLEGPRLNFCTRGKCSHLLIPMRDCPHCNHRTYNTRTQTCDNSGCPMHGKVFDPDAPPPETEVPEPPPPQQEQQQDNGSRPPWQQTPPDNTTSMPAPEAPATQSGQIRLPDNGSRDDNGRREEKTSFVPRNKPQIIGGPKPQSEQQPSNEETVTAATATPPSSTASDEDSSGADNDSPQPPWSQAPADAPAREQTPDEPQTPEAPQTPQPSEGGDASVQEQRPKQEQSSTAAESPWLRHNEPSATPPADTSPTWPQPPAQDEATQPAGNIWDRPLQSRPQQGQAPAESGSPWTAGAVARPASGAPAAPSRQAQRSQTTDGSIWEAYEFMKENLLRDEQGRQCPLYLVIGLAGAGKTAYLTMLGDILKHKSEKYYFPYEGVGVNEVTVSSIVRKRGTEQHYIEKLPKLSRRIRDLVWGFSGPQFDQYISKMMWADHTAPEEEGTEEVRTFFLVSELTRWGKIFGRLVTVETSGEDFRAMIEALQAEDGVDDKPRSDMQEVLLDMLDLAEGFVVLISPDKPQENDLVFKNLFLRLKQHLEPRAMAAYYRRLREILRLEAEGEPGLISVIDKMRRVEEMRREREERIATRMQEWRQQLAGLLRRFKDPVDSDVFSEPALKQIDQLFQKTFPEKYAQARQVMVGDRPALEQIRSFYNGLVKQAGKEEVLRQLVMQEIGNGNGHTGDASQIPQGMLEIAQRRLADEFGLKNWRVALTPDLQPEGTPTRLLNLKHLSLVVTKSDVHPIVYPPHHYPETKMPTCKLFVQDIDNYLRLLGGGIRYYNASATGYSFLRDTLHYPGKANTLTPINIVEPIFDMMHIDSQ